MNSAPEKRQSESLTRMEKLNAFSNTECIQGCNKKWLKCARQVLQWNSINPYVFAAAIPELLQKGWNKKLSIFLIGPSNCGKSFLLQPLELIFKWFTSPAQGKYTWTGLGKAEVVFFNMFCWPKGLIAWHELLNLLVGGPYKLSRPTNIFATDLSIRRSNGNLFFATEIQSTEFVGAYGQRNERETNVMDKWLKIFEFTHQILNN